MSDRSYGERAIRPVRRSGNSLVVSIPPSILHSAGLGIDDKVEVRPARDGGGIELRRREEDTETGGDTAEADAPNATTYSGGD